MYFSPAFVLAALPFLTAATPVSEVLKARSSSTGISLSKRPGLRNDDGTVNTAVLRSSQALSISCVLNLIVSRILAHLALRLL